ncbi:MAG TPA: hypothetical protein VF607_08550 [Verrucomicrobiae bacterium]
MNRPLTAAENELIRWMLLHGAPNAANYLPQLEKAQVSPNRCPCGCGSIDFIIAGMPEPTGGINRIADFIFEEEGNLSGIFVFEQNGILGGLELYGLDSDAPKVLPTKEMLRPNPTAPAGEKVKHQA